MKESKDLVLTGKAAKSLAQEAVLEFAEDKKTVGEHRGSFRVDSKITAHRFEAKLPGYTGWEWEAVLARPSLSKEITVYSVALVASEGAIIPQPWVPWADRILPMDIQPWDLLQYKPNDPNLMISKMPKSPIDDIEKLALYRERIISPFGKEDTLKRWYFSKRGPKSKSSTVATEICTSCGFFIPLSGELGQGFGVCSNAFSSEDGTVVSLDHGCGAHSETSLPPDNRYYSDSKFVYRDIDVKMSLEEQQNSYQV